MIGLAPCKINLGLQVLGKLPNDYHQINSILYPLDFYDIIEIIPDSSFHFKETGLKVDGKIEENLCVKAYLLMRDLYNLPPVSIHLHKQIPMGAGLGGGSSDASQVILLLNKMFVLNLSASEMEKQAAKLGSDCPFFIQSKTAIASETGTNLKLIDLKLEDKYVCLVKPNIHISTADAYGGIEAFPEEIDLEKQIKTPPSEWKDFLLNDFEKSIFPKYPELSEIKEKLLNHGALYAAMSGSGATIYGIFERQIEIDFPEEYFVHWLKLS